MEPIVLFENADVLVVNKPAGLVVHADGKTKEPTLADWLGGQYPGLRGVGEPWTTPSGDVIARPGIVHRLDRETSGVLIIAKTQETFLYLKGLFQNRQVKKIYHVFVYGHFKEETGTIEKPIGRSPSDFRRWSAQPGARGELRDAVTHWKVVLQGVDQDEPVSYLEVQLETGRTHQIRVHLKAIHHPVVCDKLYAPKSPCLLDFARTALHAHSLSLVLPDGTEQTFEAPLPADFGRATQSLTIG